MSVVVYPNEGKWVALQVSKSYAESMLGVVLSLTLFYDTPVYILNADYETCKEIFQTKAVPGNDQIRQLKAAASLYVAGDEESVLAYKDLVSFMLGDFKRAVDEITKVTCVIKPYKYEGLLVDSVCGMPLPLKSDGTPIDCDCIRLVDFNPGVLGEFFKTAVDISDSGLPIFSQSCITSEAPVKKYDSLYDQFRSMFE